MLTYEVTKCKQAQSVCCVLKMCKTEKAGSCKQKETREESVVRMKAA